MQSKKLLRFEIGHCVRLPCLIGKLDQQSLFAVSLQKFNYGPYLPLR